MSSSQPDSFAPYADLEPETILQAIESVGILCDGHMLALNSYENRVYQIGVEEGQPIVAKFYRPNRWSNEAILEEHAFTLELASREIPVVPPMADETGKTLHEFQGYRFALFPRQGGRWPDLDDPEKLAWLGRFMGRIHAVAGVERFQHRPALDLQSFGIDSYRYLLDHDFLPDYLQDNYRTVVEELLAKVELRFELAEPIRRIRLHGDCHPGNILWTDNGPHFVDFDDSRMGPAIQDLWMLLSGERHEQEQQLAAIIEGYEEFMAFDPMELILIESLRSLRLIHYAAWLARRWQDPAFPQSFPWFNTPRYWEEHVQSLREQLAIIDEPALKLER